WNKGAFYGERHLGARVECMKKRLESEEVSRWLEESVVEVRVRECNSEQVLEGSKHLRELQAISARCQFQVRRPYRHAYNSLRRCLESEHLSHRAKARRREARRPKKGSKRAPCHSSLIEIGEHQQRLWQRHERPEVEGQERLWKLPRVSFGDGGSHERTGLTRASQDGGHDPALAGRGME
ncbi:hypothetical protein CLAIMM_12361 isoform 1, partial [Cladophialophora immunda]